MPTTIAASPILSGSLQDLGTAELLSFLGSTGATGRLDVHADLEVRLWWRHGRVVAGDSEAEPDLAEALAARSAHTRTPISPTMVQRFIEDRRVDAVFQAMVMDGASFAFHRDAPVPAHWPDTGAGSEPADLLAAAESRLTRWRAIAASIPSVSSRVSMATGLPDGVGSVTLDRDEFALLALLDGQRTIAELTAAVGAGAFETCERLHELVRRGVATVVTPD